MEKDQRNEFDVTAEYLNGVIGTLSCGCSMTDDECWTAEYLMRRCQVFIDEFHKRFNKNRS